jgi:hypothetical protein
MKERKKTKEGGLSPQEGDVRRRKEDDQGRWSVAKRRGREKVPEKVRDQKARRWLREGKVPCVLNREFLFLVHEYLGFERPVSLKYRLLRDLVYEEAMCEGSSGTDYLTQREQYLNRTTLRRSKIPLRSFRSEECRTFALERSVSEKAVF